MVTNTVYECRASVNKKMGCKTICHFNFIINQISEVPAGVTQALGNYLFLGNLDPDGKIENEYVKFVMDLAEG